MGLQYEVTYILNGGVLPTGVNNPQNVNEGTLTTELPNPTKPNDGFDGWFTNTGLTSQYQGSVTAQITLFAKWTTEISS